MNARDQIERRKAEAAERIANALEGLIDMLKKPPMIQTPAEPVAKIEEPSWFNESGDKTVDPLPDDSVEVLTDEVPRDDE